MKNMLLFTCLGIVLMIPMPATADQKNRIHQDKKTYLKISSEQSMKLSDPSSSELYVGDERLNFYTPSEEIICLRNKRILYATKQIYPSRTVNSYENHMYVCDFMNKKMIDIANEIFAIIITDMPNYGFIPASKVFVIENDLYVLESALKEHKKKSYYGYCMKCHVIYERKLKNKHTKHKLIHNYYNADKTFLISTIIKKRMESKKTKFY